MHGKREYGDYQTPIDFAEKVCRYLSDCCRIKPSAVVEPTCGIGGFLKSSLLFEANEYYGIEINAEYCRICRDFISEEKVKIIHSDFFSFSSKSLIKDKRQVLVLGNPPWVTNSTLSVLASDNLPVKANFKGLKGIEAITGAGNFDICEYIILQLVNEYRDTNAVIAMLCKMSVARNIFKELKRSYISFNKYDVLEFDASKVFGINVHACLLVIQLSDQGASLDAYKVYDFEYPETVKAQFKYSNGQFCRDLGKRREDFDGQCCFEWRQGVKHDCSKIMELTLRDGKLQNGQGETMDIENDIVFPLMKSSMFKKPVIHDFSKFVIVTQKKVREGTEHLKKEVPKTWQYLSAHTALFESRKSSIYRGAPPFSMFGVGAYSYEKYKVGVSGFYKKPLFTLLYSEDGKPVMTDDTSYFICFDRYDAAYIAMLLLNSSKVQDFLTGIAFLDAKRPYTKKVLERIDFDKIVNDLSLDDLRKTEEALALSHYATSSMYEEFRSLLGVERLQFA